MVLRLLKIFKGILFWIFEKKPVNVKSSETWKSILKISREEKFEILNKCIQVENFENKTVLQISIKCWQFLKKKSCGFQFLQITQT